jgi:hypothetical protein
LRQEIARIPEVVERARATPAEFDAEIERQRRLASAGADHAGVVLDARIEGDTIVTEPEAN